MQYFKVVFLRRSNRVHDCKTCSWLMATRHLQGSCHAYWTLLCGHVPFSKIRESSQARLIGIAYCPLHKIHSNASSIEGYFSQSFTTFGPASKHANYLVWIFPRKKSEASRSKAQLPSTYPHKEVVQVHIKALLAGNKGQAFPGFSLRDIPWKAFHCKNTRLWRTWRGRLNHYKGCQKETWMFHFDSCQTAPSVIKK